MNLEWAPHVTVAAVVERDGTFLLVEERADGNRVLNQPAGHLDDGESLTDAVIREVREETGLAFTPDSLVGIYQWRHPDEETFLRVTYCGSAHGEADPVDPEIIGLHWLSAKRLHDGTLPLRSPLVLRSVDDYLAGRRFPLSVLAEI